VFQVRVIDLDPELSGRSREVVVKVVADRMPVPPTRAPFEPVEFENLTVTPYVIDRTKRLGYSLRATGIKGGRPMAQAHRLADALAAYIADLKTHVTTTPGKPEGVAA